MEVSSSVSRWQSFGFQSLKGLNKRLQATVPNYRNIRRSIISVESANKSSSLLAVPTYVFVLETVFIISASRCTSGEFSSFSTVGPLAKDCQNNVADGLGVYKTCIGFLLRRVVLFVLSINPDFVQACVLTG